MVKNKVEKFNCPIGTTLGVIGGKSKVLIIWHLYNHKCLRYGELQKIIENITPKMLTSQLRELENDKLITRTVYPVVPPKVEYTLTNLGESLVPILFEMKKWGEFYENSQKNC